MIGVAISTRNRSDMFRDTFDRWRKHMPTDSILVVVDDASDNPNDLADFQFAANAGIPATKNKCLELLMAAGAEHLFLADDDTYPTSDDWWKPYVDGCEPHYQYSWSRFAVDNVRVPDMTRIYASPDLTGWSWSMGCLLYVTREVVDRVGGMRPEFGLGLEEHAEFSQRIHNAGFTTFVHQDHPDMAAHIHAGDEHYETKRSFTDKREIQKRLARNRTIRLNHTRSVDFVPYSAPGSRDVILTSYFTGHVDPQRKTTVWPNTVEPLQALIDSTDDLVILHNNLPDGPGRVKVDAPLVAYTQRWISQYQWLRDHPEVRWVWCVDATDVEQLKQPWTVMRPGVLYTGYEKTTLGTNWIQLHTPKELARWVRENRTRTLLNTGIVGGDRATMMRLCRTMTDLWATTDRKDPLYEMALFNKACEDFFTETGPHIVTLFKGYEVDNTTALWRHK